MVIVADGSGGEGGEEESHELGEEEELKVETVFYFNRVGNGDGLVLVVLELG